MTLKARPFRSVLVANRGEIAVRVLSEAQMTDLRAIAVYSEADAGAMHVRTADEAVCIGPAAASESYLNPEAILNAAQQTGAEAIHPGYGFLSENAAFARAVIEAGLVWIGPPPEAIEAMGDKARAKALMIEAGVPTLPGWQGEDQSDENLRAQADAVGYPLLIKAVAGGGGRGMRIVGGASEFDEALISARREAKSAFGDQAVLLERFVECGRHVEIQVFADTHGNVIHLGERDCSAQRRRQKVIEESPSPAVDEDLRQRMGADAVAAAKAVEYVGAGTVEFLLDDAGNYYFLEMNTRLQVEHTVTEAVTMYDLVQWQFDVAAGHPLPVSDDLTEDNFVGHAIEVRLYAEDPLNGFAPQSGLIAHYNTEGRTPGVRTDIGYETGDRIGTDYDPMIAKLISRGETRDAAIDYLIDHLKEAPLLGVKTNRDFLIRLLDTQTFRNGEIRTSDLDAWAEDGEGPFAPIPLPFEALAVAAADIAATETPVLRSASVTSFDADFEVDGEAVTVRVEQTPTGGVIVTQGDARAEVEILERWAEVLKVRIDGVVRMVPAAVGADDALYTALPEHLARIVEASLWSDGLASDPSRVTAPVSGAVVAVNVKPGDAVKAGDVAVVMEAMKMEMRLTVEADGVIAAVNAEAGCQASGGAVLIELDLDEQG